MNKVIIGIHGLDNKPPRQVLEMWWRKAIIEGLDNIGSPFPFLKFELVYWADCFHSEPLNPLLKDTQDALYVKHPYVAAEKISSLNTKGIKRKIKDRFYKHLMGRSLYTHIPGVTNWFLRTNFKDFYLYYHLNQNGNNHADGEGAKEIIKRRLIQTLRKYEGSSIMLIAHSMGSLIAYDVLTRISNLPDIHTFITVGSPLSLPLVLKKLTKVHDHDKTESNSLTVPDQISRSWYNLYDPDDQVAQKGGFSELFKANERNVHVNDIKVNNRYAYRGEALPHNVFGYLRTEEIAGILSAFLEEGKSKWQSWITRKINRTFQAWERLRT